MLIIKPIQEKSRQEQICAACEVTYRPETFAYSAYDDDTLIGVCQFTMGNGKAELTDLKTVPGTDDEEALFIMARAMMSFVDKCAIPTLSTTDTASDPALLKKLGFTSNKATLSQIFKCRDAGDAT